MPNRKKWIRYVLYAVEILLLFLCFLQFLCLALKLLVQTFKFFLCYDILP